MPSSKDIILKSLRAQNAPDVALPEVATGPWITYENTTQQFAAVLQGVGGHCVEVETVADLVAELERNVHFASAAKICSLVPGVSSRAVDLCAIDDPHDLKDIDFALLPGEFAVAENGAVWVTDQHVRHRVLYFLPQHLAFVVRADAVLDNMHQAYERLQIGNGLLGTRLLGDSPRGAGQFGAFVSGPSKTADIEQSLVIGAHGARSLTVFLLKR